MSIEKNNLDKKNPDLPSQEAEDTIKGYINFLKSEPYNAVDFDPSKDKEEDESGYLLKYSSGISIYFKKKSFFFKFVQKSQSLCIFFCSP